MPDLVPRHSSRKPTFADFLTDDVAEVLNLMTVDAQRLQDNLTYLHIVWSGLFQIVRFRRAARKGVNIGKLKGKLKAS